MDRVNPYSHLPDRAFWAPAVAQRSMFDIAELWQPKFEISTSDKIATFGSCFAQHFSRKLVQSGFSWLDCEPGPQHLTPQQKAQFNYSVFSARTGNIYTTSLLHQWLRWANDPQLAPNEVWVDGARFIDPFRPVIEPTGFASIHELQQSRSLCIEAVRRSVVEANLFVFTMGLTESWWHADQAHEYPLCPGTVGGVFDSQQHRFLNQRSSFVLEHLEASLSILRALNPTLRVLLTVSPVPLVATNSGNHVLVATSESKSTLRSVAGEVAAKHDFVDYFPSFEIINAAPFRGAFFEPNLRSVNASGVDHVMAQFFGAVVKQPTSSKKRALKAEPLQDDVACEEALLASMKQST